MEKEKIAETNSENKFEKYNPNSIGELIGIGRDLLTDPEKVYRTVGSKEAIDDIEASGVVRNRQSAGLVEKSRWGERVFWSKGAQDKYHPVSQNGYVIEAPLSIAQERIVTREDVTAIYTKNENNEVIDTLKQEREVEEIKRQEILEQRQSKDAQDLADIRKSLSLSE